MEQIGEFGCECCLVFEIQKDIQKRSNQLLHAWMLKGCTNRFSLIDCHRYVEMGRMLKLNNILQKKASGLTQKSSASGPWAPKKKFQLHNFERKHESNASRAFLQTRWRQREECQRIRRCDGCQLGKLVAWPVLIPRIPTKGCLPLSSNVLNFYLRFPCVIWKQ